MPKTIPKETIVAGHARRVAERARTAGVVDLLLADVPMEAIIEGCLVEAVLEDRDAAAAAAALPEIPVGVITTERVHHPPRSVRAGKRRQRKKKAR